jgi:hypothetical protein
MSAPLERSARGPGGSAFVGRERGAALRTFAKIRERDAAGLSTSAAAVREPEAATPQAAPVVQSAALGRGPLTAGGVMRLQRAVGNRAVGRLLGGQLQSQSASAPLIQRVKTEKERGDKHKRIANANATIEFLRDEGDKKLLKTSLDKHVFEARPVNGGEPDKDHPSGLHAYSDTEGGLHGGITGAVTKGSNTKVHELEWHWPGKAATKKSTMFPKWMPKDHVRALIALKFAATRAKALTEEEEGELSKADTRTYIQRGLDITIEKSGDTVYPVL